MTNTRFFLTFILVTLLALTGYVGGLVGGAHSAEAASTEPVSIIIDGQQVPSDVSPRIVDGRTLVPLRVISENLGAGVAWEGSTQTVTVTSGGSAVVLRIGQMQAMVHGEPVTLDVAPVIYDGRALVPLRFLGETFGAEVDWDAQRRQVTVQRPHAVLTEVDVVRNSDVGGVVLRLSAPADYSISYLEKDADKPYRMIVDLVGVRSNLPSSEFAVGAGGILRGRVVERPGGEEGIRVIFDMNEASRVEAVRSGNGRDIELQLPYQVVGLRYGHTETGQAVFIEANGPITARSLTLSDPDRIAIDIQGMVMSSQVPAVLEVGTGFVPRIRAAQFDSSTVRVVVDLQGSAGHTITTDGNRAVVYVHQSGSGRQPIVSPGEGTVVPIDSSVLAGRRIVIDAGHGGRDPGSISVSGVNEKELTLATAQVLQKMLTEAGAHVITTRNGDFYVDLYDRAEIANQSGADAFVSIHMNSYHNPQLSGTETYHHPSAVEGRRLAKLAHEEMLKGLGLPDRGVRTADFVVLRETAMAAALVEAGYLSNPTEEQLLLDSGVRLRIAESLYRALVRFFQ